MGLVVREAGRSNFRVFVAAFDKGRRTLKVLRRELYGSYGLHENMSLEQARAAASTYNKKQQRLKRSQVAASARASDDIIKKELFVPEHLVSGFEEELNQIYCFNPRRLKMIKKHWNVASKIIAEVGVGPERYNDEKLKIYYYFNLKKWSPSYIQDLISILNRFGDYCSRQSRTFYTHLPQLNNIQKNQLLEARESLTGIKRASKPLAASHLLSTKFTFENEELLLQYNYMHIALWLGLRPKEIDSLELNKTYKLEYDNINKVEVILVYQSKLTSLVKEQRWKPIALITDEQRQAVELIKSMQYKRPLVKTLKRILGDGYDCYSGRKGFTDLMLSKGLSIENISIFLGHTDISMTWKHYKSRNRFSL